MAEPTGVDVDAIARELCETDALTPNDGETLHPDHYIVDAENLPYLVSTVLTLFARQSASAAEAQSDALQRLVAQALRQAREAVHVERFAHDEGAARGPDNFYNGMLHARKVLDDRASATLDGSLPLPGTDLNPIRS